MSKSDSLRLRDIRAAFGLIGECRDLGREPGLWHRRMLEGLVLLFGVAQAVSCEAWSDRARSRVEPVAAYSVSTNSAADDAMRAYLDADPKEDPLYQEIRKLPGKLITRTRRQLVCDDHWYRSVTFNEYRKV